jgi:hypothetical protein
MLNLIKNQKLILTSWQILLVIILVLGLFFRFANLDRKVYWSDETFTSLRVSGYTAEAYTTPLDLTYLLNPNVKLQPVMRQTIDLPDGERVQKHSLKPISEGFSDIFGFGHNDPNSHLVQEFLEQQQYKLKEVHRSKRWIDPVYETKLVLWRVSKAQKTNK